MSEAAHWRNRHAEITTRRWPGTRQPDSKVQTRRRGWGDSTGNTTTCARRSPGRWNTGAARWHCALGVALYGLWKLRGHLDEVGAGCRRSWRPRRRFRHRTL
ncbi:MAG: hypothetical protein U0232_05960 [Thermomicrobiales bacterium]